VKQLSKVKVSFIRQILKLHRRSMIAPDSYARAALNSSFDPAAKGKKSWVKGLIKTATRMPFHLPEFNPSHTTTVTDLEDYAKLVKIFMLEWLQEEINSLEKLY
jgi:hypothetical protein